MLINKSKLLILFAIISNINIYGGAFNNEITAVQQAYKTLISQVNTAHYTDLNDYHNGYAQEVNLQNLKTTLQKFLPNITNLSSSTDIDSLSQQVEMLSNNLSGIMPELGAIAGAEVDWIDDEAGSNPLGYLTTDGGALIAALNNLTQAINTFEAQSFLELSMQLIQPQISALNNYMSTVNNLGTDFQTIFNNINSSTIAGTLSSTLTNTSSANSLISNLTSLIGNNTFGTGNTGLNQGANWWKKPNQTIVLNMQNAAIASQNIITIISNYQKNITTDPKTLIPFVSNNTPVNNNTLLQLSIQLIQTQISALNNYMGTVNSLGSDFQTIFNNINSSTLAGTLSSTLTNTSSVNNLISNLTSLIGNNTFGTGNTGLNQGANWWKKPNQTVLLNMQNAAIASQNIITIISNYQKNITTDPKKLIPFVSNNTPTNNTPTGTTMSSAMVSSIQASYKDMLTQLNLITNNGSGHPTDWDGFIVSGIANNALITAINNNTGTYNTAIAVLQTNHNQLSNIDDALWNLLSLQSTLSGYVTNNNTYYIPGGTTIGNNINSIINDANNMITQLQNYKAGAGITTTITVNS